MERSQTLLVSEDSEVITDGQTDNTGRSSDRLTLSASSSSGDLAYKGIGSACTDSHYLESSPLARSSCFYDENGNFVVKPSFSNDHDLDSLSKSFLNLRQSDFHWTLKDGGAELSSSIESSLDAELATELLLSSFVYRDNDDQNSNELLLIALLLSSTVNSPELIQLPSRALTFTNTPVFTPSVNKVEQVVELSSTSINDVSNSGQAHQILVDSDIRREKSIVLSVTPSSPDISKSTFNDHTALGVASQGVPLSILHDSFISEEAQEFERGIGGNNSPRVSGFRVNKSVRFPSLSVTSAISSNTILVSSANNSQDILSSEFWNFENITSTFDKLSSDTKILDFFFSSVSSDQTDTTLPEVRESGSVPVYEEGLHDSTSVSVNDAHYSSTKCTSAAYDSYNVPTSEVHDCSIVSITEVPGNSRILIENSEESIAAIPTSKLVSSSFAEIGDVTDVLIPDAPYNFPIDVELSGSYQGVLNYSDKQAYFTSSENFETASNHYESYSQNEEKTEGEWLSSSQPANIRAGNTPLVSLTNRYFVTDDIVPSDSFLAVWYQTDSENLESFVLTAHTTPFTLVDSTRFLFFPDIVTDTGNVDNLQANNQTFSSQSVNWTTDTEFSIENSVGYRLKEVSSAILETNKVSFSSPATVNELHKLTEPSHSLLSERTERNQWSGNSDRLYSPKMENSTMVSTYLQPSSTMAYGSGFYDRTVTIKNAMNEAIVPYDIPLSEDISRQFPSSQSSFSSTVTQDPNVDDTEIQRIYPAHTIDATPIVLGTSAMCSEISCASSRLPFFVPDTSSTTQETTAADGGTSPKQMPNFNTTIIIASACAVMALVIFVIIAIFCLRRKKGIKSQPSRLSGDDLWVDLYRSNSAHHMPLPSLTTCQSTFEMTDALKPGSTQDLNDDKQRRAAVLPSFPQRSQVKQQRQVSSFQIKKPNPDAERENGLTYPVIELEGPVGLDQAECWVNMTTSVSMTSLPTTELSYYTNVTDYNLAAVGHKFRAVYAYKPVCKGEMALKEGELVVCKERDRNGWMFGSKPKTNEEGWFPAVYVDEISSDDELDFSCDIPETYDILESNKLHNADQYWTGIEHRVCYRYESSVPGDLKIEPGQTVIVLQTLANGWWFAVNGTSCGWFPGSYVEMIVDNSTPEQPSNSDSHEKEHDQPGVSTESQSTNDDTTGSQTAPTRTETEDKSVAVVSQLPERDEIKQKDFAKQERTNEAVPAAEPTNIGVKLSSSKAQEVSDKNELVEQISATDTGATQSSAILTPHRQAPDKPGTHLTVSTSTNHTSNSSLTRKSTQNEKNPGKSLRPARPAPPPPKRKDSAKVSKDSTLSKDTNSETPINKAQATVLKKPVILIQGKRPKLQKVLRSQLDEKQLNPMIRPSTRGFIPKPTANAESRLTFTRCYDYQRNEYKSTEQEHTNSSSSIADDFHNELMILLSQQHQTAGKISPSHALGFKPLYLNHGRSSSKTSLDSGSDCRLHYPHRLDIKENFPNTEQNETKHSKNILNSFSKGRSLTPDNKRDRSLTPDNKRERSLTPEYKRDKNNSPLLLTTGNLLHNVQRFDGALRHPSPSSVETEIGTLKVSSTEKGDSELTLHYRPMDTFNLASHRQRAPTTISPPKIPLIDISHNRASPIIQEEQNSNHSTQNVLLNYDSFNKPVSEVPPSTTFPSLQAVSPESNREDITECKRHTSSLSKPDYNALNRDSLVVTPGTVSEIVHQINNQAPLQKEML